MMITKVQRYTQTRYRAVGYNKGDTMRIFLVRHGMSQSNADWGVNTKVADHAIELTEEGKEQARKAGEFLADYFTKRVAFPSFPELARLPKIRLWLSPYCRTRQTAAGIQETCILNRDAEILHRRPEGGVHLLDNVVTTRKAGESLFFDRREHLLLAEQQFGVFDGLSDAEREEFYPREQAYYEKCKKFEGKLWPKMPLGESRFEVCQRVHQAFGSFKRDEERHGIENIVVVGHGTTNRAFTMMWLHLPYEWMHTEPNPKNCSIRLIEDGEDKGYVFEGFDNPSGYKHKTNRETEE
jgi:2,3-bisphosphoglycerate-dependent phosphoglycerate mutase